MSDGYDRGTERSQNARKWLKDPWKEWHAVKNRDRPYAYTECGETIHDEEIIWGAVYSNIRADDDICPACETLIRLNGGDAHPSGCPSCDGQIIDAYELPGGDVVHADDVPYSDGPMGVTATHVCRACGTRVEVDNDE